MSKLLFEKLLLLSPSSLPLLFLAKFKSSQLQYLSSFPVFWKNKVVLLRSHIDLSNSLPRVQGLAFPSLVSRMTSFTSEPPLTLRVSLCQLTSTSDKLKNLDFITKLIEQAANSGSKVRSNLNCPNSSSQLFEIIMNRFHRSFSFQNV